MIFKGVIVIEISRRFKKTEKYEKVKEYDNFILFKNEKTGVRECFQKTDIAAYENGTIKIL